MVSKYTSSYLALSLSHLWLPDSGRATLIGLSKKRSIKLMIDVHFMIYSRRIVSIVLVSSNGFKGDSWLRLSYEKREEYVC
jgi:hypothetical protein